ncbi:MULTISPECIES: GntR family transcriptional regulator [unclassified Variovorax]|uniref:GntR family transcriptional regulator n=1 Tax=unclassified Variovorax TaxID=663243 RepID=UPI0009FCB98D|nr:MULTISPECIES: GntR family transcriptional regulator [unclassified Variovorax]PNG59540.1 HTH-type transcriptional repressor RspR [Variovorax sp. B4]PNG60669.1 HTH-type transcriptional repressor RspR [Variovorax sp. B2]VTV13434.1 putative HTH-type transcriptional regulator YdfH [Variovorax sp. WDL1]
MNAPTKSSSLPPTAQDRAYSSIKEAVINLDYRAGESLRAQEIAARLGLSRTPVREALGRLQQEGLVRHDSGWGYVVRAMTQKEINDLFNLREILEVSAAVEAMTFLDEAGIEKLAGFLKSARRELQRGQLAKTRAFNSDFRLALASASRNTLLSQILLTINDRVRWLGSMQIQSRPGRVQESLEENEEILEALKSRDAALVKNAVLNHVRRARESVMTNVAPFL